VLKEIINKVVMLVERVAGMIDGKTKKKIAIEIIKMLCKQLNIDLNIVKADELIDRTVQRYNIDSTIFNRNKLKRNI
jgi:hypothetical protein